MCPPDSFKASVFVGNMRSVIASSFPTLIFSRQKKIAEIFPYLHNTKTQGGFLKFLKNPRARLLPGVSGVGALFSSVVGRGGFYSFVINQRVQLAVFVRRAAGVFI